MSFWSALGKGLLSAVPVVGPALASMGQASTSNRGAAEDTQLRRDQIGLQAASDYDQALLDRARLDLDRRKFGQDTQSDAFMKSLRSALALNFSPVSRPSGVPTISFVGKGIGEQGKQAAEELNRQVLLKLMEGEKFDPIAAPERYVPAAAPKASTFEKVMGVLAPTLSAAGTIASMTQQSGGAKTASAAPASLNPNIWSKIRF